MLQVVGGTYTLFPVNEIMGNTRIVITVDKSVREDVRKIAKAEGKILSAKYRELFLKGHQLESVAK